MGWGRGKAKRHRREDRDVGAEGVGCGSPLGGSNLDLKCSTCSTFWELFPVQLAGLNAFMLKIHYTRFPVNGEAVFPVNGEATDLLGPYGLATGKPV